MTGRRFARAFLLIVATACSKDGRGSPTLPSGAKAPQSVPVRSAVPSGAGTPQAPAPAAAKAPHTPTLPVGFLRPDGVVLVDFLVADSAQMVPSTDDVLYPLDLPDQWYVTSAKTQPFVARASLKVHAFLGESEAGPVWGIGQVTDAHCGADSTQLVTCLALGRSLPTSFFRADSSRTGSRGALMALVQSEFTDSARREEWKARPDLGPIGPPAPIHVIWWSSAIPESDDTMQIVQAERIYTGKWGAETWLLNLWVVPRGGRLQVVRRRGPVASDPDYKGAPSEEPMVMFRYNGRTMIIFSWLGYGIGGHALAELVDGHAVELAR